jgi:glycosyltransferase involved in cell wall biosynthesis
MSDAGDAPRFSILVAAHNASGTLSATLESVSAQTFDDWEVCVVDDGSTDSTFDVAATHAAGDDRFKVVAQANRGTAAARNAAARIAKGELFAILDADDLYLPDYLASMDRFIGEHPGYDIYSCSGYYLYPSGLRLPVPRSGRFRHVTSYSLEDMLDRTHLFVIAVVTRAAFESVGGFREGVYAEDYDLWLRLLASGATHIQDPEKLAVYRVKADSKSSDRLTNVESVISVLEHLRERVELTASAQAALGASLDRQAKLAELSKLERRLSSGDYRGARVAFTSLGSALSTRPRYLGGLAIMWASPRLYRRVFLDGGLK